LSFLNSLKEKSFVGLTWSFAESIFGNGVSFLVGVILARILDPSDFGLIGIITAVLSITTIFVDSGFSTGLIRKEHCSTNEYSTVFYFNVITGGVIYLLLYYSAPFFSNYFGQPSLERLIRVLGLVVIIDSFSIIQRVILTKNIEFKTQTIVSVISSIVGGIVGISLAYSGKGIWSLVIMLLVRQFCICTLFWFVSEWKPIVVFSIPVFREIFGFGYKILFSGLIGAVQNNVIYIVIGRWFSTASLGYYTRAEQFNAIVSSNLLSIFDRVFFPVLSSIQGDDKKLKNAFRKVTKMSFLVTFLSLSILASVAKPVVLILLGHKWDVSIIYLQLLCLGSVFIPLSSINLNILKIKGRSDLILKLQILKTFLVIANLAVGIYFGIIPMLITRIGAVAIAYFLNGIYSALLINYSLREQFTDIAPYFFAVVLIGAIVFSISFVSINIFLMLAIQLALGFLLFLFLFEKFQWDEYQEIKQLLLNYVRR
jgi:teichuronic acid exporter